MKLFALAVFAAMVLVTIGFANSADEMRESDARRDAEFFAGERAMEQAGADPRAAVTLSAGVQGARQQ